MLSETQLLVRGTKCIQVVERRRCPCFADAHVIRTSYCSGSVLWLRTFLEPGLVFSRAVPWE